MIKRIAIAAVSATLAVGVFSACDNKKQPTPTTTTTTKKDDHGHDHDHDHAHGDAVKLGTATIAGFTVTASMEGAVKAGEEAHVDLSITGGTGTPKGVRVWIGTEDGAGSVKSLAERGDHGYHAHAEAPNPLPEGSKLWVSIDDEQGVTHMGSFELK